jgi:hypothetical protein
MHPVATALLAAGLFGGSFTAVMFFSSSSPDHPKPTATCEDVATIDTLKRLALKKLKEGTSSEYLLKSADYNERIFILIGASNGGVEFTISGFRDRGKIGDGSSCAAQIRVKAINRTESAEMSTEYSVEPTSDGKVMVSARFMPN